LRRDPSVNRHPALIALERRSDDSSDQRNSARRRDSVFALSAHERVDIGLLGFQRDIEPGGRAEGKRRVSIRSDCSFFRTETKFRPAHSGLIEVGA